MARFDLVMAFDVLFPKIAKGICRYCKNPILKNDKYRQNRVWHSDCKILASTMISWEATRQIVYDRDKGICQMCGTKVFLHDPWIIDHYTTDEKIKYAEYFSRCVGERKAEIHHVIPWVELDDIAVQVVSEIQDQEKRQYWYWKLGIMLQLDVNNLTTLCVHPCHDDVHNRENNLKRKQVQNDKIWEKCSTEQF